MIKWGEKSCKEGVCSIEYFLYTTRCCACFSNYAHTFSLQGYLNIYLGVCTFGVLQPTANFRKKMKDPLEAILVIFGRRALIFFLFEALGKK